ncbi:hypothetical protein K2173_028438 [Erythroxylum novogranatense]|uniref:PXMP2/4 family protein 4-like n=1 Tax=Erythroxylum novogranatense TaxID=1862640 RepID=A0AAV8U1V1_9ROSI|nr:hypothetical protein K2173_028438 [Erythroxylum novogranatense]
MGGASVKSTAKRCVTANFLSKGSCTNQQQQRFCTSTRSSHNIKKTRDSKASVFLFVPSRSFSESSYSNSKSKLGLLGWYMGKLNSHPATTKTITTSLIYAASDMTAQMISSQSSDSLDAIRTLRMAGYGFVFLGPSQHLWFNAMSRALPKRDMLSTLAKIFLGQGVYGPVNTTLFFSYNAALQGENGGEITARLKRDLLPTLVNGLLYWPICDFATYKFTPVHLQPLVNSTCAYAWTIYLTYMASLKKVSSP